MSGLGPSSPSSAEPRRGVTGATSRSAPTPVRFSHPGATRPGAARGGVGRRVRGAALPGSNGPGLCTSSYGSIRSDGTGDGPGRRLILAASIEGIALGVHPQVYNATTPLMATGPAARRARGQCSWGERRGRGVEESLAEAGQPKHQNPTREKRNRINHFRQKKKRVYHVCTERQLGICTFAPLHIRPPRTPSLPHLRSRPSLPASSSPRTCGLRSASAPP